VREAVSLAARRGGGRRAEGTTLREVAVLCGLGSPSPPPGPRGSQTQRV